MDDKDITLDNWKPADRTSVLVKSAWRDAVNGGNYNQMPALDELRKITANINKKYPDHQIMEAFGISAETLAAIKKDRYCPIDGISLDSQGKIYREFDRIHKRLERYQMAFNFIADNCIKDKHNINRGLLKNLIKLKKEKLDEDLEGSDE